MEKTPCVYAQGTLSSLFIHLLDCTTRELWVVLHLSDQEPPSSFPTLHRQHGGRNRLQFAVYYVENHIVLIFYFRFGFFHDAALQCRRVIWFFAWVCLHLFLCVLCVPGTDAAVVVLRSGQQGRNSRTSKCGTLKIEPSQTKMFVAFASRIQHLAINNLCTGRFIQLGLRRSKQTTTVAVVFVFGESYLR